MQKQIGTTLIGRYLLYLQKLISSCLFIFFWYKPNVLTILKHINYLSRVPVSVATLLIYICRAMFLKLITRTLHSVVFWPIYWSKRFNWWMVFFFRIHSFKMRINKMTCTSKTNELIKCLIEDTLKIRRLGYISLSTYLYFFSLPIG